MTSAIRGARVLVVDDDADLRDGLRRALSAEGYAIALASDGSEALARIRESPPDIVVLDILLPGIDGLEVCRRIRDADARLPVLLLTAKDGATDQIAGLDAGADDYLVKPFSIGVLAARLRALLRRELPVGEVLRYRDLELDTASRAARRGAREIHLTSTEFRLLAELLRHPERVLDKEWLTQRVWGYDFTGNYNVVEVYIRYLREKLEQGGECRLIHTLRGAGYVLRASPP
ncbi:MAG TPA: response regulator transcription factor [Candidatus Limnocylindria bacterium]|nr:response regulator transcription factor [Candidatus Limnocylindria bacterium]